VSRGRGRRNVRHRRAAGDWRYGGWLRLAKAPDREPWRSRCAPVLAEYRDGAIMFASSIRLLAPPQASTCVRAKR